MTRAEAFDKLLAESVLLLNKRYRDGECDGVALHVFAQRVEDIATEADACPHTRLTVTEGDETFYPRTGCLDCEKWLTEPELRPRASWKAGQ